MTARLKRLPAHFYRLASRREPVREWLKSLAADDRRTIGEDIKDVEYSWPTRTTPSSDLALARRRRLGAR